MLRVILKSKENAHLVGFAKKKHRELAALRVRLKLPVSQKTITVDDSTIKIFSSNWDNYVELQGGPTFVPDMILSGGDTQAYNYSKNKLRKLVNKTGAVFRGSFGKVLQLSSNLLYLVKGAKVSSSEVNVLMDETLHHVVRDGADKSKDTIVVLKNNSLYASQSGPQDFSFCATLDSSLQYRAGGKKSLTDHRYYVGVLGDEPGSGLSGGGWNQARSPQLAGVNLSIPGRAENKYWKWYPRIANPSLANSLFLKQGLYYGSFIGGGFWGPFSNVKVMFLGIMDNRGGSSEFGYMEMLLSSTDKDGVQDSYAEAFFIDQKWEPSRETFFNINYGILSFQNDYWASMPSPRFRVNVASYFPLEEAQNVDVFWWCMKEIPPDPDDLLGLPRPHHGVLLASGTNDRGWVLLRYAGYMMPIMEGAGYLDHSYSANGEIVSVLYNKDGADHVFVYDMGAKPSGKVLAHNKATKKALFQSCALVEKEERDALHVAKDIGAASTNPERAKEFEPSLFGMWHPFPPYNGYRAGGWKVQILGRVAQGIQWEDDCWKNAKYTRWELDEDSKYGVFDASNLVAAGGPNGRHHTVGSIEGRDSNIFPTAGGKSPAGKDPVVVERAEIGFGRSATTGCLVPTTGNIKGPVSITGDAEKRVHPTDPTAECWVPVPGCRTDDEGRPLADVKIKDACGMEAEGTFSFEPLRISGPAVFLNGETYSAYGGSPPYTFSSDCGTIESATGKVTDDSTCCGVTSTTLSEVEVTVTDSCGRRASTVSRGKNGMWAVVSQSGEYKDVAYLQRIDSTTERRTYQYVPNGCECSPLMWRWYGDPELDQCLENTHDCTGSGYAGTSNFSGCGSPGVSSPHISELPGKLTAVHPPDFSQSCSSSGGNYIDFYGVHLYAKDPGFLLVEKWVCP